MDALGMQKTHRFHVFLHVFARTVDFKIVSHSSCLSWRLMV